MQKFFARDGAKLAGRLHGIAVTDTSDARERGMTQPLGLIAGEGVFPLLVARGARSAGRKVVCAALTGSAWPELREECDHFTWVGVTRLGRWIRVLKSAGCSEAIMVGRVTKTRMYDRWRYFRYIPDLLTAKVWFRRLRHDRTPQAMLSAIAETLAGNGITLIDSTAYTPDQLAIPGVMTSRQPSESQWSATGLHW